MAGYRARSDGLFDVDVPGVGMMPMAVSEEQLQARGLTPYMDAPAPMMPDLRLAQAASPVAPTMDNVAAASEATTFDVNYNPHAGTMSVSGGPPQRLYSGPEDAPPPPGPAQAPLVAARAAAPAGPGVQAAPGRRSGDIDKLTADQYERDLKGKPAWSMKVPGGDQRVGFATQKQEGPDPKTWENYVHAREGMVQSTEETAQAGAERMKQRADQVEGTLGATPDYDLIVKENQRAHIDGEISDRLKQINTRRDEWREKASQPFDEWKDRSAVAGVFAAIAAALGAYGAAKAGTKNFALEILNDSANREYQAHRDAIANAKDAITIEKDDLAQLIKTHGDPRSAELEFKMQRTEIAAVRAEAEALRSGSVELVERAKLFRAAVDEENAGRAMELSALIRGTVAEQFRYQAPRVVSGGGGMDPVKAAKRAAEFRGALHTMTDLPEPGKGMDPAKYDPNKDPAKLWVPAPFPGMPGGWSYDGDTAPKLRVKAQATKRMDDLLTEVETLRETFKEGPSAKGYIESKARLEGIRADLLGAYKQAEELGALDKGVLEISEKKFGAPSEWLSAQGILSRTKIGEARRSLRSNWDAVAQTQLTGEAPTPGARPREPLKPQLPPSFKPE